MERPFVNADISLGHPEVKCNRSAGDVSQVRPQFNGEDGLFLFHEIIWESMLK